MLRERELTVRTVGPQEVHDRSDDMGDDILGEQPGDRYRDLMGARVNTLKELDTLASSTCETLEQVAEAVAYLFE